MERQQFLRNKKIQNIIAWVVCIIMVFMIFFHGFPELFKSIYYATGDSAANSLIIQKAKHFNLFTGNYSRTGFYHPGPFYFYVQAIFEIIFYNLLHLVPGAYNANIFGMIVYYTFCIIISVFFIKKELGLSSYASILVCISLSGLVSMIVRIMWPPYWYLVTFLPFVITLFYTICRKYQYMPWCILFVCILVHGHICFSAYAICSAIIIIAVILKKENVDIWLTTNKKYFIISLGIIMVFILPIILETVVSYPGEIPYYLDYVGHSKVDRTIIDAIKFLLRYYKVYGIVALVLSVIMARIVIGITEKRKEYCIFLCVLFILNFIGFIYIYLQLDSLDEVNIYTCYFIYAIYIIFLIYTTIQMVLSFMKSSRYFGVFSIILAFICFEVIFSSVSQSHAVEDIPLQFNQLKSYIEEKSGKNIKNEKVTLVQMDNNAWVFIVNCLCFKELYDDINLDVFLTWDSRTLECLYTPEQVTKKIDNDHLFVYVASSKDYFSEELRINAVEIGGCYLSYSMDGYLQNKIIDPSSLFYPDECTGYYGYENTHVWVNKESSVHLYNEKISESGLQIDFRIPEQVLISGSNYIEIFVNDKLVYSMNATQAGEQSLNIDSSEIRNDEDNYIIKIICEHSFNPKEMGASDDNRDLAIAILYIGEIK